MDTTAPRLRPMGIVDQLDLAFRLYRRQFATFAGIVAVLQVPATLLSAIYSVVYLVPFNERLLQEMAASEPNPEGLNVLMRDIEPLLGQMLVGFIVIMLLSTLVQMLTTAAVAYAGSRAYLGEPVDLVGAYDYLAHGTRLLRLIGASLAVGLVYVLITLAMVLPSIVSPVLACCSLPLGVVAMVYVSLRLILVTQVVVLEDRGSLEGVGRAWRLIDGHMTRVLGLVVILVLLIYFVPQALQSLASLIIEAVSPSMALNVILESAVGAAVQAVTLPIVLCALTFFYYDLRIRKEGFDLEMQAAQLTGGGAGDAPA